jgi:DNA-binding response OmpR family regulator
MEEPASTGAAGELCGKVLYIEDVLVNFQFVQGLMRRHRKVSLLHAATGMEGVRLVRSERPDFVLLDMHLPDIGGLDVVRLLSEDIAEHGLRVTILTGDRLTMDIIKAMSLGAYEYWVKPIDHRVLDDGLRRALTGRRPDPAHRLAVPSSGN